MTYLIRLDTFDVCLREFEIRNEAFDGVLSCKSSIKEI